MNALVSLICGSSMVRLKMSPTQNTMRCLKNTFSLNVILINIWSPHLLVWKYWSQYFMIVLMLVSFSHFIKLLLPNSQLHCKSELIIELIVLNWIISLSFDLSYRLETVYVCIHASCALICLALHHLIVQQHKQYRCIHSALNYLLTIIMFFLFTIADNLLSICRHCFIIIFNEISHYRQRYYLLEENHFAATLDIAT